MSSLCIGTGIDEWFPIQYKGKQSGTIHLKSVWKPGAGGKAAKAGTAGAANMMQQPAYAMGGYGYPQGMAVAQPYVMGMGMQQPMMMQ